MKDDNFGFTFGDNGERVSGSDFHTSNSEKLDFANSRVERLKELEKKTKEVKEEYLAHISEIEGAQSEELFDDDKNKKRGL